MLNLPTRSLFTRWTYWSDPCADLCLTLTMRHQKATITLSLIHSRSFDNSKDLS